MLQAGSWKRGSGSRIASVGVAFLALLVLTGASRRLSETTLLRSEWPGLRIALPEWKVAQEILTPSSSLVQVMLPGGSEEFV